MSNKTTDILKLQTKFGGEEYIYKGNRTGLREFDPNFEVCICKKCNNKKLINVFNKFSGDRTHWCPICKAEEFIENTNIVERANKEDKSTSQYNFSWTHNTDEITLEQDKNKLSLTDRIKSKLSSKK